MDTDGYINREFLLNDITCKHCGGVKSYTENNIKCLINCSEYYKHIKRHSIYHHYGVWCSDKKCRHFIELDDLLPRVVKNRVSEKIDRHMITLLCCGRKFKCSLEDFKIIKRSKNFLFVEYGKEIEFISVTCQKCKKETLIREEDFKLKAFTKILKKL